MGLRNSSYRLKGGPPGMGPRTFTNSSKRYMTPNRLETRSLGPRVICGEERAWRGCPFGSHMAEPWVQISLVTSADTPVLS